MKTDLAGPRFSHGKQLIDDTSNPPNDLKAALGNFETCLVTPIVSGELADWLDEVRKAWAEASTQVHYHIKHLYPRQYEEIAKQDPELLPRIELLKAEDEAIEQQRQQFSQSVGRVAQHAPNSSRMKKRRRNTPRRWLTMEWRF